MSGGRNRKVDRGEVRLNAVSISHSTREVVRDATLMIAPGEFICLLGPSGCGKTTILRAMAGLKAIDAGTIHIDGVLANLLPAHRRNVAMVFQDLALFPHMTVSENIAFGLKLRRVQLDEIRTQIAGMLALLHLDGLENRLPRQLSGGQQQRVAIARSLVINPSVLLLDEPFAALDRKLREEMRREIRALQRKVGLTVVFVTHDQEEALAVADRVVVMNQGVIEQVGSPTEIYESPASRFVLDFVGIANFLNIDSLERTNAALRCRLAGVPLILGNTLVPGVASGAVPQIALRPERIHIVEAGSKAPVNTITGVISEIVYEGAMVTYQVNLSDGQSLIVRESNLSGTRDRRRVGDVVAMLWRCEDVLLVADPSSVAESRLTREYCGDSL